MSDYRVTEFEKDFINLKLKKSNFKKQILKGHPKIKNFYINLRDKDAGYKQRFISIYNDKCVYCGNTLDLLNIDLFEIDHYINEASFSKILKSQANAIENLVPACQLCNRSKSGITIKGCYATLLDPEDIHIKDIFIRKANYSIDVSDKYKGDKFVLQFYENMRFSSEIRRLDYLLISMRGLYNKLASDNKLKNNLLAIIDKLQLKRNRLY